MNRKINALRKQPWFGSLVHLVMTESVTYKRAREWLQSTGVSIEAFTKRETYRDMKRFLLRSDNTQWIWFYCVSMLVKEIKPYYNYWTRGDDISNPKQFLRTTPVTYKEVGNVLKYIDTLYEETALRMFYALRGNHEFVAAILTWAILRKEVQMTSEEVATLKEQISRLTRGRSELPDDILRLIESKLPAHNSMKGVYGNSIKSTVKQLRS